MPKLKFFSGILTLFIFISFHLSMNGDKKDKVKEQPFINIFSPLKFNFSKEVETWARLLKVRYPELFNKAVVKVPEEEDENAPAIIKYNARDAIVIDIKTHNIGLRGKGIIEYRKFKLEAEEVMLDWTTNIITARGRKSITGDYIGKPIFTQEEIEKDRYGRPMPTSKKQVYYSEEIQFNINSGRAIASKLVTKRDSDVIKAENLKKDDDETFYLGNATYTTCDLPNPHFFINANQAKMVVDKKIISGPFRFYFDGVPVPLGWVFGIVFLPGRTHGIIVPDAGEDDSKGFYLKDAGYYINFNDYATLTLKGDIYSKGEANMDNKFHYKKRYSYEGFIQYNRSFQVGDGSSNKNSKKGWQLKLNHQVNSATFGADVVICNNAYEAFVQEQHRGEREKKDYSKTTSYVYWKPKFIGFPYRLTLNGKYECVFDNNFRTLMFPEVSLKTGYIFPFNINQSSVNGRNWYTDIYKKFQFEHSIKFMHSISNRSWQAQQEEKENKNTTIKYKDKLQYIQNGICHTVPIKTTIPLFTYLRLNPSFTYTERWYFKQLNWKDNQRTEFSSGFFRVYDYQFKGNLTTILYSTYSFSDESFFKGIRIVSEPSVSIMYIPNFSEDQYKHYQKVDGQKRYKYKDFVYQNTELKERAQMILGITLKNNLTLKVAESTGKDGYEEKENKNKKIIILDSLDLCTDYDFKEEKYPLSMITLTIRTGAITLHNGTLKFNSQMKFDPYYYENDEKKTYLAWTQDQFIGRLDNMNMEVIVNWKGKNNENTKKENQDELESASFFVNDNIQKRTNFNAPWNIEIKYNWDYYRNYESMGSSFFPQKHLSDSSKKEEKKQSVSLDGSFNLTPKWKISFTGTYNIIDKEIIRESSFISINRDLHCWELAYKWWPFGYDNRAKTKYEFSLGIKAESLKFLKYPRKKSYQKIKRLKKL